MPLRDQLSRFIAERLIHDRNAKVDPNDSLLARGLIDSVGLLDLITFLETEAGVRVPDDDMVPQNFETIVAMEQLVERLKGR